MPVVQNKANAVILMIIDRHHKTPDQKSCIFKEIYSSSLPHNTTKGSK